MTAHLERAGPAAAARAGLAASSVAAAAAAGGAAAAGHGPPGGLLVMQPTAESVGPAGHVLVIRRPAGPSAARARLPAAGWALAASLTRIHVCSTPAAVVAWHTLLLYATRPAGRSAAF